MTVLSIDLAYKRLEDIGVCVLRSEGSGIVATPIRLAALGLAGRPAAAGLARTVADLAEREGAGLVLVDGPQAWKAPDNGLPHARVCERRLATQGKTGLPGATKPASYAPFTTFSIALFDALAAHGWPRLPDGAALHSGGRFALESFPTAAWRALGLRPLAAKAKSTTQDVAEKLAELSTLLPVSVAAALPLTHDELQALVAGLAGLGAQGHPALGFALAGDPPSEREGTWREGFIVNPTRRGVETAGRAPRQRASPGALRPALVPEFYVSDLRASLAFYVDVLGFRIEYERPEEGFAALSLGRAWLMLEQPPSLRRATSAEIEQGQWRTADLERPFGRGVNLEIEVADVAAAAARIARHGRPLLRPLHEKRYRVDEAVRSVRQLVVADPDGYLIRLSQRIGA